jgi:SNF2 family DNA or RNA helicase
MIGFLSFSSWLNDTNVILADEMGLGKTVQSVSMLGFLQVKIFFFSSERSSLLMIWKSCSLFLALLFMS